MYCAVLLASSVGNVKIPQASPVAFHDESSDLKARRSKWLHERIDQPMPEEIIVELDAALKARKLEKEVIATHGNGKHPSPRPAIAVKVNADITEHIQAARLRSRAKAAAAEKPSVEWRENRS